MDRRRHRPTRQSQFQSHEMPIRVAQECRIALKFPFAWAGLYFLESGDFDLVLVPGPSLVLHTTLLPFSGRDQLELADAVEVFMHQAYVAKRGDVLRPDGRLAQLGVFRNVSCYRLMVETTGVYALFAEYPLDEFGGQIFGETGEIKPVVTHEYERELF